MKGTQNDKGTVMVHTCRECHLSWPNSKQDYTCPNCDSFDIEILVEWSKEEFFDNA